MKRSSASLFWILLVLVISVIHLVPIYITVMVSLKAQTDLSSYWVVKIFNFPDNYRIAIETGKLLRAFLNTAVISLGSVLLIIVLSAMAAYPLTRNPSRFNRIVTIFVLSILMIPALSLLVPLYVLLLRIGGISTRWGIILVHVAFNLPLSIFLFSNFIRTIPRALDDAALIDGCHVYRIFAVIILPLLKPVTVTVIILSGVVIWNDYQFSLYFLQNPKVHVITLAISQFFAISGSDPHVAAAAAVLAIFPITVLYLFLQKYFVKGMVDGAIK